MSRAQRALNAQRKAKAQSEEQARIRETIRENERIGAPSSERITATDDGLLDMDEGIACPVCNSPQTKGQAFLGALGTRHFFRCRYCGIGFSHDGTSTNVQL